MKILEILESEVLGVASLAPLARRSGPGLECALAGLLGPLAGLLGPRGVLGTTKEVLGTPRESLGITRNCTYPYQDSYDPYQDSCYYLRGFKIKIKSKSNRIEIKIIGSPIKKHRKS